METNRPSKPQGFEPTPTFSGRLTVKPYDPTSPDAAATEYLIKLYSHKDGFHCPVCKTVIANSTEAVEHLAEELNRGFDKLRKGVK
jgi:hypothetical protein